MSIYKAPDGTEYNIPTDPGERDYFAKAVQYAYGEDINQTTILGRATEFAKAIPREAVAGFQQVPVGLAQLFDMGNDNPMTKSFERQQEEWRTQGPFAGDPAYQDLYSTKVGGGLGSLIPFLGAGLAGRALAARGVGAKLPKYLQPSWTVPYAFAGPSGIAEQANFLQQARDEGKEVGPVAEILAELGGALIGATELFPIEKLLKRVPKNALNYPEVRRMLRSGLQQGGVEAGQEVFAGISQRLLARGLYSDDLPLTESVWDDMTVGGGVGFIADVVVNSISRRSRGRSYLKDAEQRARDNRVDLTSKGKFERGVSQGTLQEVQDEPVVTKPEIPLPRPVGVTPNLEVIQTPDSKFSVVDLNAVENPVLKQFDGEADAVIFKNKQQTNFLREQLAYDIEDAAYSLGMPDSDSARTLGGTILDPNNVELNLQSLIEFDKNLSDDQKKKFAAERKQAGWFGKNVPSEMIERKKDFLKETGKYLNSKGLDLKASYSIAEVKKALSVKNYNELLNDWAAEVFQKSEQAGEPSITADKDKPNVNLKYIKDIAASKNIDLDFNDPAVRYAALQWTGTANMSKTRNRGVKALFLARLHSLPKFNNRTKFPDFRPRAYTAQDVANFVASMGSRNVKFTVDDLLKAGVTAKDKTATEQFVNDLVTSGRAEKIKNTNQYQIRKNHEFDIARRAEGFSQTPREFGDMLRKEGKLPEKTIQQLVEQETTRQRRVLPPEEIESKTIKFNEAVEEGRTNVFARELKTILEERGLGETGVIVSNDILSSSALARTPQGEIVFDPRGLRQTETEGAVEGEYDRNTDIIFLSLNAINPDGNASTDQIRESLHKVLDHEMIHALREKDLITEKEYQYLRKEVKRKKVPQGFDANFKGRSFYQRAKAMNEQRTKGTGDLVGRNEQFKEELYVEEAIAEMYRSRNFKPDIAPKAEGIFNKIVEFFRSMGQAMRTSGFKKASDVFAEIEQGRVGSRARGEIRTLRELDKLAPEAVDAPIIEEFIEGEAPVNQPIDVVSLGESGAIATPVTTFKDIEADTDLITGVVLTPSGLWRSGESIYNFREQTEEQLQSQRAVIIQEFGYGHVKSEDVLTWLSKNAPNEDYRVIADRLLTQIKKLKRIHKIDFQFKIIKKGTDRLSISGHKGADLDWHGVSYSPFHYEGGLRQQIYISDRGLNHYKGESVQGSNVDGVNLATILHELVHQATQAATRYDYRADAKTKENIAELEKIRKRVSEEINTRRKAGEIPDFYVKYGTKNVQELLAVGFTDRKFQEFMEAIPYSPRGKKSLWDKFTESLRKLLNIPAKQGTVFSEFLLQAGRITNLSQKQISPLFGVGLEASGGADFGPPAAEYQRRKRFTSDIDFSEVLNKGGQEIQRYWFHNLRGRLPAPGGGISAYDPTGVEGNYTNSVMLSRTPFAGGLEDNLIVDMAKLQGDKSSKDFFTLSDFPAPGRLVRTHMTEGHVAFGGDIPGSAIVQKSTSQSVSPNKESIQERINEIDVRLMSLESEMRKEGGLMGRKNYIILSKKIDGLKSERYHLERQLAETERKPTSPEQIPLFSRGTRFADDRNTNENIQLREATEKAVEVVKKTPRGEVPYYNVNASDVALKAAIDFNEDATAKAPDDIPNFSRAPLPEFIQEIAEEIGQPKYEISKSSGARLIDIASNPVANIRKAFKGFRSSVVDALDPIVKRQMQFAQEDNETRLSNNLADTSAIAALRLADRARGIFSQMLMKGVPVGQIDDKPSITWVKDFEISTRHNSFIDGDTGTGGLMQITAPLFSDPSVDLEGVFGVYGKLKRQEDLNKQGKEIASPITSQHIEAIAEIEARFPQVVEVYNNYQNWNNELIKFAESKGLLSPEQSKLWRKHSSYYPFYRDMVDETGDITAPKIGGGMLPNNPLNIVMKGSEEEINVPPLEAIARNSLSILTASMKNDGAAKLMRDFVANGMAKKVNAKGASGKISIPVFKNGIKEFYLVKDLEVYEAMRGIGGVKTDLMTKILQFPSTILRDTVTRDPGFIMVNLLRDTLSSAVTAGNIGFGEGDFTPVVDTLKGMFSDMSDLEKFGIIGGYDFANDEGSVVDLMAKARRREGLTPDNGITAQDAFYKLWDGLGGLTTKSDGATRLGVYKAVYNNLKERGYTEAQAQSEAAYQGLEIINFGRRGNSVLFRYLTSAVPFLNARIQGLDVLWRSGSGQYSAIEKQREGETLKDVQRRIQKGFLTRGGLLMLITAVYYAMVSDTDEYKEVKREVRDDNWLIPTPFDYTIKLPIPFEVGMLFKAIPERIIDEYFGRQVEKNISKSIGRQLETSANFPFITGDVGIQAVKPLFEAIINRNSWTDTAIVPYYKEKEMPAYQSRQSTNEIARLIGEALNISPMKIEHVLNGYSGTLGGYLLDLMDVTARRITGTPLMPANINSIPLIKRLLIDNDKGGGLQQSFYELREEVTGATATINSLRDEGRMDELAAYREHNKGLLNAKGQVNAINRFMGNWRKKRDRLLRRTDLSAMIKADMLRELEIRRDKRLSIVPALRQKADAPRVSLGN